MRSGFINLIKPPGATSSDMVGFVRRCLPKGTRVGHMGTLDPDAVGVLPIGVGKAARLFDEVVDKRKIYLADMALGVETDTQDASGQAVRSGNPSAITAVDIMTAARSFLGRIQQTPPMYSAIRIGGKRLYELARQGETAQVSAREVEVHRIDLIAYRGNRALLEIECGRGTYIRTLLHDMGRRLGCGAHMAYLARVAAGPFTIQEGILPERFRETCKEGNPALCPMDLPLGHLPRVDCAQEMAHAVRNGNPLPLGDAPLRQGEKCRVYLCGAFAGIARREEGALRFQSMLLEEWE